MKTKVLLFSLAVFVSYGTRAQTSFGGFRDSDGANNAGAGGGNTNSYFGYQSGFFSNGIENTFLGYRSGYSNSGNQNTFLGYQSGRNNTTGIGNTFLGRTSGLDNTSGNNNTFLGVNSGHNNTIGDNNTYLGRNSGNFNQTGSGNVFVGYRAGYNEMGSDLLYIDNSDTSEPLIWGDFATDVLQFNGSVRITDITQDDALTHVLVEDADGDIFWRDAASLGGGGGVPHDFPSYPDSAGDLGGNTNSYFGHDAGLVNTGTNNTFVGNQSGQNNTTGVNNTFLGRSSGRDNDNGIGNTFVGMSSGSQHTSGDNNVFLGSLSGAENTTGHSNTFLGTQSGRSNNGLGNVFIGYFTGFNEMGSNLLYIDNSSTSSPLIWGDFAADALRFNGTVGIDNIPNNDTLTQVLVTDATGNINWRDAASLGDGTGTDDQQLSLVGNDLQLEDGGNVDLSPYLDNTDSQTLNFDIGTNILSITGGNNVDLSSLAGGGGGGVPHDFPSYPESAGDGGGDNTNSFFGHLTGSATTGADNTLVGYQSGLNNTTGYENSSLGSRTLENNTTGARNTANGVFTLFGNTIGIENTAVGYAALGFNTTGNGNTATGYQTLLNNGGNYNTADGYQALFNNISGSNNTATGHNALIGNTTGSNNVAIGNDTSIYNETGMENVAIGFNSGATFGNSGLNNAIAIGSNVGVTASNQVRLGNFEVEDIMGAATWTVVSDGRFKINIEEDVAGLDFIKGLRPVSYNLDRRKIRAFTGKTNATNSDVSKKIVGFVAQDVEQLVQENDYVFTGVKAPENDKDHYGLKYSEFVVPLTKAVQELSAIVEAQQQEINELKSMLNGSIKATDGGTKTLRTTDTAAKSDFALNQNVPNPFDKTTVISATVPETVRQAKITVYNLNGLELQSYDLNKRGNVAVEISGGVLPSGMYLYALIADGQIIDTKKMILTK